MKKAAFGNGTISGTDYLHQHSEDVLLFLLLFLFLWSALSTSSRTPELKPSRKVLTWDVKQTTPVLWRACSRYSQAGGGCDGVKGENERLISFSLFTPRVSAVMDIASRKRTRKAAHNPFVPLNSLISIKACCHSPPSLHPFLAWNGGVFGTLEAPYFHHHTQPPPPPIPPTLPRRSSDSLLSNSATST